MNNVTKKWVLLKVSSAILVPLMCWFIINFVGIFDKDYTDLIEKQISNWDIDRLAQIDIILLKMALCEFEHFAGIPVKVSMNEYIEISKYYSTAKSKLFVNGLLDNFVKTYTRDGKIKKIGRGLV